MPININKLHRRLYMVYENDECYIFKLPIEDVDNQTLSSEYDMYNIMSKKSSAFNAFNTLFELKCNNIDYIPFKTHNQIIKVIKSKIELNIDLNINPINMLRGMYNSNYNTIHLWNKHDDFSSRPNKNTIEFMNGMIFKIINTIENVFRPNNFIHGDLKYNNILVNKNNYADIKIIDLEFSFIMSKDIITITDDLSISMYLNDSDIKLTKQYLHLFDVFLFVRSIVAFSMYFPRKIYDILLMHFNSINCHTDTFMEFFIIYRILKDASCSSHYWNECLDARITTINNVILNTGLKSLNAVYEEHMVRITEIISENIRINVKHYIDSKLDEINIVTIDNNKRNRLNGSTPTFESEKASTEDILSV
jgi:hypothetical protein